MATLAVGLLALSVLVAVPASAAGAPPDADGGGRVIEADDALPGRYVVVLGQEAPTAAPSVLTERAHGLAAGHDAEVTAVYRHALDGFAASMSAEDAAALAAEPGVVAVYEDAVHRADEIQPGAPWGLDRVDQRDLPLDGDFSHGRTGAGVTAYVIDSGIRGSHQEFGGRVVAGWSAFGAGSPADQDCNGHGTHVAGILGGAGYGVAKDVTMVAVRVLSCTGSTDTSDLVAAVDWVLGDADHNGDGDARDTGEWPIANMSIGGPPHGALEAAVANSISAGVTYAVSAGNFDTDACGQSPARVPPAVTVAATTATDARASFSNVGTCVDLFAPGAEIASAGHLGDADTEVVSGTSQAAPHVAGALAVLRERYPADLYFGSIPVLVIRELLVGAATAGLVSDPGTGTPNRLLHQEPPRIGLRLEALGEPGTDFPFRLCTAEGADCQTAILDDDGVPDRIDRTSFLVEGAGSWVLDGSEAPAGWGLESVTCTGGEGEVDLGAALVTLDLAAAERTSCTFTYEEDRPGIAGTVVADEGGAPVDGAWVIGVNLAGGRLTGAPTSADGAFDLPVVAGTYLTQVVDPLRRYRGEYFDDRPLGDLAGASLVVVDGPATADFGLTRRVGDIAGTVTDADGGPLGGIWVAAFDLSTSVLAGTVTEADGAYRLQDLEPGPYLLAFVDPSGARPFEFFSDRTAPQIADPAVVAAGSTVTADAALGAADPPAGPTGTVGGTVLGWVGQPLAGAWVLAISPDGRMAGGVATAADGTYSLTLPAGTHRLQFLDPGGGAAGEYHGNVGLDRYHDATPVTVQPAVPVEVDAVLGAATGAVAGRVRSQGTGVGLTGAWIVALAPDGTIEAATVAAGDGTYVLEGLPPGDHVLVFLDPGGRHRTEFFDNGPGFADATPVTVAGPGEVASADAALAPF